MELTCLITGIIVSSITYTIGFYCGTRPDPDPQIIDAENNGPTAEETRALASLKPKTGDSYYLPLSQLTIVFTETGGK